MAGHRRAASSLEPFTQLTIPNSQQFTIPDCQHPSALPNGPVLSPQKRDCSTGWIPSLLYPPEDTQKMKSLEKLTFCPGPFFLWNWEGMDSLQLHPKFNARDSKFHIWVVLSAVVQSAWVGPFDHFHNFLFWSCWTSSFLAALSSSCLSD